MRNNIETSQQAKQNKLQIAYSVLSDNIDDSLETILQNMDIIVRYDGISNAPVSAIANCLLNTEIKVRSSDFSKLNDDYKVNWLMVNEYAEREYASSISNNHTRIFAGRLLSLLMKNG